MKMGSSTVSKILSSRRITLTRDFCDKWGLREGDWVKLIESGDSKRPHLIVKPVKVTFEDVE